MSPKIEQDSLISESELDDMMLGDQDMFGKSRVERLNVFIGVFEVRIYLLLVFV